MTTTYEQIMYAKILTHANCVVEQESFATGFSWDECAIVITNYHDGANVAIECQKCSEVIIDFDKPGDGEEIQDNARLISASPDLLAALRQLMEWEGYDGGPPGNGHDEDTDRREQEVWQDAQDAIDKATGQEEEHVCDVEDKWCQEGANPYRHPDHDSHVGGCNCPLGQEETA